MGFFDEQIQYRVDKDNENFADALHSVAGAVMGKRLVEALSANEIAQSAIEEILKYYHLKASTDEFPKGVDSLEDRLEYRMRPFGIMRRRVELDPGWYHDAIGAMLGTLKADGRAVALIPDSFGGYSYFDLATGKRVKINRKTELLLDTEAMVFYRPLPLKKLSTKDLLLFMGQLLNASDIAMLVGMAALSALLGLLSPMLNKWLMGDVLESGSLSVLLSIAGFMLCFSISSMILNIFRSVATARINTKINIAVQAAVMNRLMSLPAPFFKEYSSGELNQRSAYVQNLCSVIFETVLSTGLTSVFSLVYIGQIFNFAPALVLPSLIITLTTVGVSLLITLGMIKINEEKMLLSAKTSGLTYSTITGMQKIKLAGAEKRMFSRWARAYSAEAALEYNPPFLLTIGPTISLAVNVIGTLVMYFLAVESNVSVSDYFAFNTSYGMVSGAFFSLASIAATIARIKPALEMSRPILEAEPEIADGKQVVTELKGSIELSNVCFRYDESMPYVINNLSLKIRPGEYLAIVGSTGCGKSTLLRLLLGFEKPQRGSIYYDRRDISKVDLKSLRRKIGTVTQDGKLFLSDIYSNIVIAAPELTLRDAWEAAEIASVADDIRALPMGMHTLISEGQGGISGGQKQRLMIARAVAPKPKILMFDEATSALDNVTQKKVSDAIDSLKCTRIVIAHRLSTIRHADRIIFLDGGKIVEDGTYEELIEKNGYFADLVKRQRLDVDVDE